MIVKVGVAIENDSKYLYEDYEVDITSWLDLRHIAKQNNVLPRGLAYLAQETVGE
jgi:3''-5'' exonuclease.